MELEESGEEELKSLVTVNRVRQGRRICSCS